MAPDILGIMSTRGDTISGTATQVLLKKDCQAAFLWAFLAVDHIHVIFLQESSFLYLERSYDRSL